MKSKIRRMAISPEASAAFKELKDSPFYSAIKEYAREYQRYHMELAFFLNETDEALAIKHARYTSAARGLQDLLDFIEKDVRRESEE